MMAFFGNIIWILFGGFFAFIGYCVAGVAMCLTIIGIPFGIQAFKLALGVLWPFGRVIRGHPESDSPLRIIFNILWLVVCGWELALHHLFWALVFGITIIGIPFALQHLKLARLAVWPFGYDFASADLVTQGVMAHTTRA